MISYIKGILEDMSPGMVVVDNHGIGYQMMVPMRGESFPKIGQEIKIYTHMHVREDDVSLFGFLSKEEKEAFELLIGVNGIGPKVGLSVLSTLSVYELKMAVISEDVKTISKTPGLGPKGAKKLILELKDKLNSNKEYLNLMSEFEKNKKLYIENNTLDDEIMTLRKKLFKIDELKEYLKIQNNLRLLSININNIILSVLD